MKVLNHLLPLICILATVHLTYAQSEDESLISNDKELDNESPVDQEPGSDHDKAEGSGNTPIENLTSSSEVTHMEEILTTEYTPTTESPNDDIICPESCYCSQENLIITIDCSLKDLVDVPENIDPRVNILILDNNQISTIPKKISEFKDLEVLNVKENKITAFEYGSISELPKLRVLNVANNKLLDIPQELKNALDFHNFKELDISGNDIRNEITPSEFSNLQGLQSIIIPQNITQSLDIFCKELSNLKQVCVNDCESELHECVVKEDEDDIPVIAATEKVLDVSKNIDSTSDLQYEKGDNLFNSDIQEEIPKIEEASSNTDPEITTSQDNLTPDISKLDGMEQNATEDINNEVGINEENATEDSINDIVIAAAKGNDKLDKTNLIKELGQKEENIQVDTTHSTSVVEDKLKVVKEEPGAAEPTGREQEKVGEVASKPGSGGVDKSVIGLIIAGMIVIVGGVTIKKNWESITKKCRGRPTPPTNGGLPEEVPLKDKSPA